MLRTRMLPIALAITILASGHGPRAHEEADRPELLGRTTVEQLRAAPFSEWFVEVYDSYTPDPRSVEAIRTIDHVDIRIGLFFATWCGDSRREVPRLLKLLDTTGLPSEHVDLIAVARSDDGLKRSPGGEQRGLEIYRVPTVIVRRAGTEIGRIVEFPVLSLERDLVAILSGEAYEPNYPSYALVRDWLARGILEDDNVSAHGLAGLLRGRISGEGELAAAARVLLARGDVREAVTLFEVNRALHPDSVRCHVDLARALRRLGDDERAQRMVERAIALNDDPEQTPELLRLLDDEPDD